MDASQWVLHRREVHKQLKAASNNHGLEWTFSDLVTKVNFMNMTISIEGSKLQTNLYIKPMTFYNFI